MATKKKTAKTKVKKKTTPSPETKEKKKVSAKKAAKKTPPRTRSRSKVSPEKSTSEAGGAKAGKPKKTARSGGKPRNKKDSGTPGPELLAAAERAAKGALKVKPAEQVVLVTDLPKVPLAEAFAHWFHHIRAETTTYLMLEALRPIKSLTGLLKSQVEGADLTVYLLEAREDEVSFRRDLVETATKNGRICSMPGITRDMIERLVNLNYRDLQGLGLSLVERMSGARKVRVTNPLGTDITFSVFGRRWMNDNGDVSRIGYHGNLPAGKCFTSPVEDTCNGVVHFSLIDTRVGKGMVVFKKGRVVDFKGKGVSDILNHIGRDAGGKIIGEFGIGTNKNAGICSNPQESEKAFGAVHFGIGDSYGLGPNRSKHHYNMVVEQASVVVDGQVILQDGEFQF